MNNKNGGKEMDFNYMTATGVPEFVTAGTTLLRQLGNQPFWSLTVLQAKPILQTFIYEMQHPAPKPKEDIDRYFTRADLAQIAHLSLPTIDRYTREGIFTGYKVGKRILYRADEIQQAMEVIPYKKYSR